MWCLYLLNHSFFTLWIMFFIPASALQYLKKFKPTSLGFIRLAFRKCWGCTRFYCWVYFRLHPYKWKSSLAISNPKGHLLLPNFMMTLTQVLTRAPTIFLHPIHGLPALLSDSWASMRDSGWNLGGNFLAAPSSTQRGQLCIFLLLFLFFLLLPLLLLHFKFELFICKWTYGLVA